jgi:4-amino-4-deoxy-L-arabinose transferase-like glycosyltransferase
MVQHGASGRPAVHRFASAPVADASAGWAGAAIAAGLLITAARLLWLAAQPAGLYPDEAQYWFWAQHLAFGYYSKPPLVAWVIAATTRIAGDGEFGVRLAAPLLHAVAAAFVYALGARLYDARTGFWSSLAYLSLPGVSASAFLMSTDAALLPCWAAALWAFVRARADGGARWWWLAGLACGLGLLAKYAMAYWFLSAFGWVLVVRGERRHLGPLCGATLLALLILAPNLVWNWQHGFVSFLHLRANADLAGPLFHPGQFAAFFGAQFAVFGPLFFAGLIWLLASRGALSEPRARLLACFTLPPIVLMLGLGLLSRANANWAAPAYVAATVLVVAWALGRGWRRFVALAIALDLFGAAALFALPTAAQAVGVALPAKYDPLHRLRGWRRLGEAVTAALAAHPGLKLLADDRETLAALIYYVRPHPFDAAKWRLDSQIGDQWDLDDELAHDRGRSFLLVSAHGLIAQMRPSFAAIDRLGPLVIPLGPGAERRYTLYIARDFKGEPPPR